MSVACQEYQQLNGAASDEDDDSNDAFAEANTKTATNTKCDPDRAHKVIQSSSCSSVAAPHDDINPTTTATTTTNIVNVSVMERKSQLVLNQQLGGDGTTHSTGDNPNARNKHTLSLNVKPVRGMLYRLRSTSL